MALPSGPKIFSWCHFLQLPLVPIALSSRSCSLQGLVSLGTKHCPARGPLPMQVPRHSRTNENLTWSGITLSTAKPSATVPSPDWLSELFLRPLATSVTVPHPLGLRRLHGGREARLSLSELPQTVGKPSLSRGPQCPHAAPQALQVLC